MPGTIVVMLLARLARLPIGCGTHAQIGQATAGLPVHGSHPVHEPVTFGFVLNDGLVMFATDRSAIVPATDPHFRKKKGLAGIQHAELQLPHAQQRWLGRCFVVDGQRCAVAGNRMEEKAVQYLAVMVRGMACAVRIVRIHASLDVGHNDVHITILQGVTIRSCLHRIGLLRGAGGCRCYDFIETSTTNNGDHRCPAGILRESARWRA